MPASRLSPAPVVAALLVAVLAVLAVGCSNDSRPFTGDAATSTTVAPPPVDAGLIVLPPGFVPADTRGVVLTPLVGDEEETEESATIPVTDPIEGEATISGRVTVDGRGAAARVRVERFVDDKVGVLDLDTDGSGAFKVDKALGGRYRIRAWDAPDYSAIPSVTVFLASDAQIDVDVPMRRFEGPRLQLALDTAVPAVGSPARLQALLTEQRVDGEGFLSGEGIEGGDLTLTTGSGLRVASANPTSTDGDGRASWQVTCRSEGAHDITVEYGELAVVVTLPACLPASEAPETTSTTGSSTTTTAAPLAVGATFTPPFSGTLPAGRYEPSSGSGCSVTYEVQSAGEWTAITEPVTGAFTLSSTARNPRPAAGTTACTYTRTA